MRIVLVGIAVVALLLFAQKINSFSEAAVKNDTSVSITEQTNALISILSKNEYQLIPGTTVEIPVEISNRVPNLIHLQADSITIDNINFTYESVTIRKGDNQSVIVKVHTEQPLTKDDIYTLPFSFEWENGKAEIPAEIKLIQ